MSLFQSLKDELLRAKFELGVLLGTTGILFLWRRLFRPEKTDRLISDSTEIVIEGFPRSGNTFAVAAFTLAQERRPVIAHHTHKVAQVAEAVKREIPTLVLIRHPADVAVSLVIRSPHLTLPQVLRNYIRYYEGIYRYQEGIVLSSFSNVVSDFGAEIKRVNEKFGTEFLPFEHTEENVQKSFALIEEMHRNSTGQGKVVERAIARPSAERRERKRELKEIVRQKQNRGILNEAEDLYRRFVCSERAQLLNSADDS